MKQARIYLDNNVLAGFLTEDDRGYEFRYDHDYLQSDGARPVSLTLPLTDKPYRDKVLFPFSTASFQKAGCSTSLKRIGKFQFATDSLCFSPAVRIASETSV